MLTSRKELYDQIYAIVSNDDNFPYVQADELAKLAKADSRLYLVILLLLIALRVTYWRKHAAELSRDAKNIGRNADALEELNTTEI